MNKNQLYAFYGSLRRGQYNNSRFDGATTMPPVVPEPVRIPGFTLYDLGPYPAVVRDPSNEEGIVVDLVKITDPSRERSIYFMEIGAGYEYDEITYNDEKYGIYTFDAPPNDKKVQGGDWAAHLRERQTPTNF